MATEPRRRRLLDTIRFLFLLALSAALMLPSPASAAQAPASPLVFLNTDLATPVGQVIPVAAGGNLQQVLDSAQPGDVIELQAGATFTGNFVLPNKSGNAWVYIRSSRHAELPSPGIRVRPSDASLMARIVTSNSSPAISAAAGAHHYRFIGIEITTSHAVTSSTQFGLVNLTASSGQTSLSQVPTDIIFDRCYIHGTSTGNVRRGIAMNSARTAVIDSYLSDFHEVGADSQAIAGWNGPGPYKIVNNYLEGAGENVLFGGSDPSISNLVPADIEVRFNYFFKPLKWKLGDPSYAGIEWSVKNILELKNARRVLVDGNIFRNNWAHSQNGFAILFTVRNQDGTAPWSTVEDVTFTRNIVRGSTSAINILGRDDLAPSQQTKRVLIQNNLFDGINGCCGRLLQMLDGTADVVLDHNTAFQTGDIVTADGQAHSGFVFRNNIVPNNQYGIGGAGTYGNPLLTLSTFFPGAVVLKNAIAGGNQNDYPVDNFFPASFAAVGFQNLDGEDYHLASTSPYKGAGTDGKDVGVDVDALNAATGGVISGVLPGPLPPNPPPDPDPAPNPPAPAPAPVPSVPEPSTSSRPAAQSSSSASNSSSSQPAPAPSSGSVASGSSAPSASPAGGGGGGGGGGGCTINFRTGGGEGWMLGSFNTVLPWLPLLLFWLRRRYALWQS